MAIRCGEQLLNCVNCGSTDLAHQADRGFGPGAPHRAEWFSRCRTCLTQTFVPDLIQARHKWP